MRRRIRVRFAVFVVSFLAICAASAALDAWVEPADMAVGAASPVANAAAAASVPADDAEWPGSIRRQAIACGGAMATVVAFAVTLGRGGHG